MPTRGTSPSLDGPATEGLARESASFKRGFCSGSEGLKVVIPFGECSTEVADTFLDDVCLGVDDAFFNDECLGVEDELSNLESLGSEVEDPPELELQSLEPPNEEDAPLLPLLDFVGVLAPLEMPEKSLCQNFKDGISGFSVSSKTEIGAPIMGAARKRNAIAKSENIVKTLTEGMSYVEGVL